MNRKNFIAKCGTGCLGVLLAQSALTGCAATKYLSAPIEGSDLVVPLSAFLVKEGGSEYHRYLVVENEKLEFPICVYRISEDTYKALWMKCTHQGTELQVFGDRLQCPAHGSEFTTSGAVQNGPASDPLRTFPIAATSASLKITLR